MMKRFSFNIGKKLSDENCLAHSPRPHLWRIERSTIAVLVLLTLNGISSLHADTAKPTVATSDTVTRKLIIDPSATSVALGKASLIVSPLTHRNGNYVGNYRLKVRPYFFKNEKGSLLLAAPDDSLRKLQTGTAVNFTGKVVTYEDGRIHVVNGRATPASADHGSVTFSIVTDNGKLVFNTSYHFEGERLGSKTAGHLDLAGADVDGSSR